MRVPPTIMRMALAVAAVLLVGCGHHEDPGTSTASTASAAKPAVPLASPSNPDDAAAWRAFLGKAILAETHDPNVHPYAFVVPGGDSTDAVQQRHGEAMAIRGMLGHTAVPGNMLAVTGPDSSLVVEVIGEAFKDVPARGAQGLTILYVGIPAALTKVPETVKAAGAELRVRAMQAP